MKSKRSRIIFISLGIAIVVVIAVAIGFSYGFFTNETEVTNKLVLGKIDIDLEEPNWDEDQGITYVPGRTMIKDPTIISTEGSSYGRIVMEFLDKNGSVITDQDRIDAIRNVIYFDVSYAKDADIKTPNLLPGNSYSLVDLEGLLDEGKIYNFYNLEAFALDTERSNNNTFIFNCTEMLSPPKEFVLFSNIVIPTDYDNEEIALLGNFQISLFAEAVQITGFEDRIEAYNELDKVGVTP